MPDDQPLSPQRRRRWALLAAVLLLMLAGAWAAQTWLTWAAKSYLDEAIGQQLGLPVSVDRLAIRLFPPALALEELRVSGPDQEPVALLDTAAVTVRFSALSLFTNELMLTEATIDRPRLALTPSRAAWIVQQLRHDGHPSDLPSIRHVIVRNGAILYADEPREIQLAVDRFGATIEFSLLTAATTLSVTDGQAAVQVGAWRQEFTSIEGQVTHARDRVTLRGVTAAGPDGEAALNGSITLAPASTANLSLSVTAALPLQQLAPLLPDGHAWRGTIGTETDVSGAWNLDQEVAQQIGKLSVAGTMSGTDLMVDEFPIGAFTAPFKLREGHLAMTGLTGTLFSGAVTGDIAASLPPSPPQWTADLTLTNLQIGPMVRHLFPSIGLPDGEADSHLVATGGPQAQRLDVQHTTFTTRQQNQLALHGTIEQPGPLALTATMRVPDLGEIGEWLSSIGLREAASWDGAVAGEGSISGTWADPRLTVEIATDALTIRGESVDEGRATVHYQAGTITIENASFQQGAGRFTGSGMMLLGKPVKPALHPGEAGAPQLNFTVSVANGGLGRILRTLGVRLAIDGQADGTLTLTGTPGRFRLYGPAHVHNGELFGQPITDSELSLELSPEGLNFPRLVLTEGTGTLRATGRIGFDGAYQVDATITSLPLGRLQWVAAHAPQLTGRLAGRISGAGTWEHPNAQAELELHELTAGPVPLGRGTLTLKLAGTRLDVASSLEEPRMTMSGSIELHDDLPATAKLSVTTFPFALLLRPFMPAWPEQVTLIASGAGELSGSLRRPSDLSGQFQFSDLTVTLADYPIANDGPLALRMHNGRVMIEQARFSGEGTTLAAEGSVTLFERYDLFIHGEAELTILRLFFPEVTYGKGKGYLALQISDRWLNPKMVGGVNIQDGLIRLDTVNEPFTVTYAGLFFDGRQLVLDNLSGTIGKGTVEATGRVALERFVPTNYRLLLEMAGVTLASVEGLSGVVDGSLWFQGELSSGATGTRRHFLKGDLQLVRATYSKRIDLKSLLAEQPAFETFRLSVPPFLGDVALQVHLQGRQAIRISNNLANIPLELDLDVRGTVEHPVLLGRISTTTGTFTFLHTPFQVSAGSIDFLDPKQTKAAVDLKARTTVRDYAIDLSLTGTTERFVLELSSDPSLSEADILSVLTVGRTTEEVTTAGAGAVATSEAAALLVDEFIEERVQKLTGVDRFQIDSVVDRSGTALGPQLTIGKQLLNDRLLVLYSTPLDPTTEALLRLEYEFNRHISLVGERDESGRLGGDLKFRFDFR